MGRCQAMKGCVDQCKDLGFYPERKKMLLKGLKQIRDVTGFAV